MTETTDTTRKTATDRLVFPRLDMMSVMILTFVVAIVAGVICAAVPLLQQQGAWAKVCTDTHTQVRVKDGLCLRDNPDPDRFTWVFYEHTDQAGYVGASTAGALTSHPKDVRLVLPAQYQPGYWR